MPIAPSNTPSLVLIGKPPAKATISLENAKPGIIPPFLSFPYTNSSINLVGKGIPAEEIAFL